MNLKAELRKFREASEGAFREQLTSCEERLAAAEGQVLELQKALERSRLLEQQASERAQEYRTSLELHREFGADFLLGGAGERGREMPVTSSLSVGTIAKLTVGNSNSMTDVEDRTSAGGDRCSTGGSVNKEAPVSEVALPSVLIA